MYVDSLSYNKRNICLVKFYWDGPCGYGSMLVKRNQTRLRKIKPKIPITDRPKEASENIKRNTWCINEIGDPIRLLTKNKPQNWFSRSSEEWDYRKQNVQMNSLGKDPTLKQMTTCCLDDATKKGISIR